MAGYLHYSIQMKDAVTGAAIITAGGTVQVCQAGLPDKQTIYSDALGTALSNPLTPTRGKIEFYTLDTVASVDLYVMAPGGQFIVAAGITPSGANELNIRTDQRRQLAVIPFSIADAVAATEKDSGFDMPANSAFLDRLHACGIRVTAAESAKTVSVGTLSTESGGAATGLINASSAAATGQVLGTNGSLFSTNAPALSDAATAKSISYTLSSGTTLVKGFAELPYQLNG